MLFKLGCYADGDQYVTPSDADLSISITRKDNGASGSSTIVSDTSVICTMDGSTIVVSTSVYDDLNTADQQLFTLPGPDSTPFNSQPLTAAFPTDVRLATLQDANGNHDALGIVLPGSEVALLVDGWVTGEADAFQTGYAVLHICLVAVWLRNVERHSRPTCSFWPVRKW